MDFIEKSMKKIKLSFLKKEQLKNNTYTYYFQPKSKFIYKAGQYLQLLLPHFRPDDKGSSRYFTIASSPTEKEIMITTRLVDNSSTFKKKLHSLKKDEIVFCYGPMGRFFLEVK